MLFQTGKNMKGIHIRELLIGWLINLNFHGHAVEVQASSMGLSLSEDKLNYFPDHNNVFIHLLYTPHPLPTWGLKAAYNL